MKIRSVVPDVNAFPTDRPRSCPYCKGAILHHHGTVKKPLKDHRATQVEVHRYKCALCLRTFRHYPPGVSKKDQSRRTAVLAALMYGLGLSCSAASHLLGVLGVELSKMSVWRDAQEAGEALRRSRPKGKVRVLGADETVYKVNNASERGIGRSKVRYKSMRGYKNMGGMANGIALTQWLYSRADEHDLSKETAA